MSQCFSHADKADKIKHVSVIRLGCLKQVFGGTHYDTELTHLTITELMKLLGRLTFFL